MTASHEVDKNATENYNINGRYIIRFLKGVFVMSHVKMHKNFLGKLIILGMACVLVFAACK